MKNSTQDFSGTNPKKYGLRRRHTDTKKHLTQSPEITESVLCENGQFSKAIRAEVKKKYYK